MSLLAQMAETFELDEEIKREDGPPSSPSAETGDLKRPAKNSATDKNELRLVVTFFLMVFVGTARAVFQKLQTIPMYNYANTLNLQANLVYVAASFVYIIPVTKLKLFGEAIPQQVATMNKKQFATMGMLDCITCTLLTFAAVYLPGSLLILLPQAAIPISMILSKHIKGESYERYQYFGAAVVVVGILVVLEPLVTHRHENDMVCEAFDQEKYCMLCNEETTEDGCLSHISGSSGHSYADLIDGQQDQVCRWISPDSAESSGLSASTKTLICFATVLACFPMSLSSIYKEMSLGGAQNIDPIFLNGWVGLFQLLFSVPMSVPAGMASSPTIWPDELPSNIIDGVLCYFGLNSIDSGCHPDHCEGSPLFVNLFLVFNILFNILLIFMLKYGSSNVLFLSSTVMVPLGNLIFALPFIPGHTPLKDSDVAGLLLIMSGLVAYRFGSAVYLQCSMSNWLPPLLSLSKRRNNITRLPADEKPALGDDSRLSDSSVDLSRPLLNPVI
mmetsp:Transcript_17363/g.40381  ORF Transcript_17363/g.40381 Transcript_17363/m.40381 type:complete len:502 (-) Transcript_17363:35-1540(-)